MPKGILLHHSVRKRRMTPILQQHTFKFMDLRLLFCMSIAASSLAPSNPISFFWSKSQHCLSTCWSVTCLQVERGKANVRQKGR